MSGQENEMEPELQPPSPPPPVAPPPPEQQQPLTRFVVHHIHRPPPSPPPPPQPHIRRVLHLRPGGLNMPTLCHKSMSWLLYLKAMGVLVRFETEYINDDGTVPHFEAEDGFYEDLELYSSSRLSMEPSVNDREKSTKEVDILKTIDDRKQAMNEHLMSLQDAYVYGCSLLDLPDEHQWISNATEEIKLRLNITDDEQLQQHLIGKMEIACQRLSDLLGDETYFMDDLRIQFADETDLFHKRRGRSTLTILDVKHAATSMLIMKCFEDHEPCDLSFNFKVKRLLRQYMSLWSHVDMLYSIYIKDRPEIINYSRRVLDPHLVTSIQESGPQASGGFGNVYRVYLEEPNGWGLKEGDYAFKFASRANASSHCENEIGYLLDLPYENVATLVGFGYESEVHFLITKWIHGGDLETRIGDLTWEQVKRILKGVAYALHMVHRTANTCMLDLKPANILINETTDPILCDFGLAATSKLYIGPEYGTSAYNDVDSVASPQRDIFSYGVIIFQLITNEVTINEGGNVFSERILPYLEELEEEKFEELIKENLRAMGCQGDIAKEIIQLGARCIGKKEYRPSALSICGKLQNIGF